MLKLKQGSERSRVRVEGIQPEIVLALLPIQSVFGAYGQDLVITSALDGRHSPSSLHYEGRAVDLRTWNLSADALERVAREIREALGPDFDVVIEPTHLHVEFDPKDDL